MNLSDLNAAVSEEVATILSSDFEIEVTATRTIPSSLDAAITFPNLDEWTQRTKLIDTCVLYIDIRKSTELNLSHRPVTVAKLYSAFVRAMVRCARQHNGHVRGIIGDRVMVLFDQADCCVNALHCAALMNSVVKYVVNKHFKHGVIKCGIGIDAGKMLATKTGIRRHGAERDAHRSLVWLGRPANVASKLTDAANKPAETILQPIVCVAYEQLFGGGWQWQDESMANFLSGLQTQYLPPHLRHKNSQYASMFMSERLITTKPATQPILMTEDVWKVYKAAKCGEDIVTKGWVTPIDISVPGYTKTIYECDLTYKVFRK